MVRKRVLGDWHEIMNNPPMGPPTANRSTRGSAMAPPHTFCKTIIQSFAWRNHKQAPPSFWSRHEEKNGIPKQLVQRAHISA